MAMLFSTVQLIYLQLSLASKTEAAILVETMDTMQVEQ